MMFSMEDTELVTMATRYHCLTSTARYQLMHTSTHMVYILYMVNIHVCRENMRLQKSMRFPNNILIEMLLVDQIISKSRTSTTQQYSSNRLKGVAVVR